MMKIVFGMVHLGHGPCLGKDPPVAPDLKGGSNRSKV